ncbi:Protein of unknown function [Izhakiella capsodis]|uniref:DUF2594 family protein n=1 Tax=Izhakiella capsodis TaxID=1367852 RepID=A0A1I4UR86_9GAMM|nr:DUF2594 family protein [Izhakiella capsodis]SFM91260.1 Protein of unknown function [Izhakiella capsodis]
MICQNFNTQQDVQTLANEVAGMKALITLILKGMGQADAGKVIINMERYIGELKDPEQAEVLSTTVKQIKQAYRQ